MKRENLLKIFEIMGLRQFARILNESEACLGFRTILTSEDAIAAGASKVGGNPDLPSSVQWPKSNGRYLDFLLQLNLAEIPENLQNYLLPKSGWLYSFYNEKSGAWGFAPRHKGSWRVIFFQGNKDELVRTRKPGAIERGTYLPCKVDFYEALCSDWPSARNHPEMKNYPEEVSKFDNLIAWMPKVPVHQIMGEPDGLQSSPEEMQRKCQFVSHGLYMGGSGGPAFDETKAKQLEPGEEEWRLLLQLDSDSDAGMEWGDRGRLYFWIREQDLQKKYFDDVWMILECF